MDGNSEAVPDVVEGVEETKVDHDTVARGAAPKVVDVVAEAAALDVVEGVEETKVDHDKAAPDAALMKKDRQTWAEMSEEVDSDSETREVVAGVVEAKVDFDKAARGFVPNVVDGDSEVVPEVVVGVEHAKMDYDKGARWFSPNFVDDDSEVVPEVVEDVEEAKVDPKNEDGEPEAMLVVEGVECPDVEALPFGPRAPTDDELLEALSHKHFETQLATTAAYILALKRLRVHCKGCGRALTAAIRTMDCVACGVHKKDAMAICPSIAGKKPLKKAACAVARCVPCGGEILRATMMQETPVERRHLLHDNLVRWAKGRTISFGTANDLRQREFNPRSGCPSYERVAAMKR